MPHSTDLVQTPSGLTQPRSMLFNQANALGFRRSGNWELTQNPHSLDFVNSVGGSWQDSSLWAASGKIKPQVHNLKLFHLSPSRLVKTLKTPN